MLSMLGFGAKYLFSMYWSLRYTEQAVEKTRTMATESTDEKKNRQLLGQLLDKPGNGTCADCGAPGIPRLVLRSPAPLCLLQPTRPNVYIYECDCCMPWSDCFMKMSI